jgi:hypothetical protein
LALVELLLLLELQAVLLEIVEVTQYLALLHPQAVAVVVLMMVLLLKMVVLAVAVLSLMALVELELQIKDLLEEQTLLH